MQYAVERAFLFAMHFNGFKVAALKSSNTDEEKTLTFLVAD